MAAYNIDEIVDVVLDCQSTFDAVYALRDALGLGHVTLNLISNFNSPMSNPFIRSTYPAEWIMKYAMNSYVEKDAVFIHGIKAKTPFFWDELEHDENSRMVMEQAARLNISPLGYSVPWLDTVGRRSLLSVTASGEPAEPREEFAKKAEIVMALAADMHTKALSEVYSDAEDLPHLAPREIECLHWYGQGKTYSEIATILDISNHTARAYLRSGRLRLDCVTLAQAVNKASKLNII